MLVAMDSCFNFYRPRQHNIANNQAKVRIEDRK